MRGRPPGIYGLDFNTQIFDSGTLNLSLSPTPGPMCYPQEFIDELTPIASYMSREMSANIQGEDVRKMKELNSFSPTKCISRYQEQPIWRQLLGFGITPEQCIDQSFTFKYAALLSWALLVMQNGPWDHKPIISQRFNPRSQGGQHWHLYGNTLYYYDVWSNIHYGYVGTASGFSESVLLDGAGLEQIGSTLLRGSLPIRSDKVKGLRAWDDDQDRAGVKMGIALYHSHPTGITATTLLNSVLSSREINIKWYGW